MSAGPCLTSIAPSAAKPDGLAAVGAGPYTSNAVRRCVPGTIGRFFDVDPAILPLNLHPLPVAACALRGREQNLFLHADVLEQAGAKLAVGRWINGGGLGYGTLEQPIQAHVVVGEQARDRPRGHAACGSSPRLQRVDRSMLLPGFLRTRPGLPRFVDACRVLGKRVAGQCVGAGA
jgi:hypothetical protein